MGHGRSAAALFAGTGARRPPRSCSAAPAIRTIRGFLGAFNEKTPDWLASSCLPIYRPGRKIPLLALAESGLHSLARTTRFMLMEEAHHMYVGESGVARVIQRTCEVMAQHKTDDPARLRALGVIDLPTIQRYLNFHFSVTIDLFGADVPRTPPRFIRAASRDATGKRHSPTTICCATRSIPCCRSLTDASKPARRRRSTRSTRSFATTTSRIPWPASDVGTGSSESPASRST